MNQANLQTLKDAAATPPALEAPASPETQKKRQAPAEPLTAIATIVTPPMPSKRRRLDLDSSLNAPSDSDTPSYAELYGDEESQKPEVRVKTRNIPMLPVLQSSRTGLYRRRNSVTKFSLQAAGNMSVLEAARLTLEKLRAESLRKRNENDSGVTKDRPDIRRIMQAALRHS